MNPSGFRERVVWIWLTGTSSALAAGPGGQHAQAPLLPAGEANATRLTDIHDIKPALAIGSDLQWLYWTLVIAGLLILATAAWRLWRKRKKTAAPELAAIPVPAETEAYQMLDDLASDGNADPKQFYFRLSAILRRYIERRYDIPASEMTTEELLPLVDRLPLGIELTQPLKAFCRGADPIKFAGVSAEQHRMAQDLSFARDFVRKSTAETDTTETAENNAQESSSGQLDKTVIKQLPLNSAKE
jgi:hypothetical protein